jgi:hypothetical protein
MKGGRKHVKEVRGRGKREEVKEVKEVKAGREG